jgi:hypothetical protein
MANEYRLSYTATEIDERLGMVDSMVKSVNGVMPDGSGNVEIQVSGGNTDQGGMTTAQINALHGMFKVCLFDDTKDVDGAISAFETAFGIAGGGEVPDEPDQPDIPDVPVVKTYSVSAELINVTSSNKATTINENASYTTTLTATDGYNLDGVTVIMDGVDVTADVYANGAISIPAVTGDVEIVATASAVEIEAELITDGLLGYWDLRNPAEVVTKDWHWAYPSNLGSGDLYGAVMGGSQGTQSLPTIDSNYGHGGFTIVNGSDTYPSNDNRAKFGTEFTFVILAHGAMPCDGANGFNGIVGSNINPRWNFMGQHYNTANTVVKPGNVGSGNGDSAEDYNFVVKRVNGSNMKVIVDTSVHEFNGVDYPDFAYWDQTVHASASYDDGTVIACAVYDRVLSDVEIEEMRAFMKTLEVTA